MCTGIDYALFCQHSTPIANSLPCRASRFCAITDDYYGPPAVVLVANSLAEWHAIGMTAPSREALMRALTDGRVRTPCPSLDALCQCGNRTELECPECARLDQQFLGRSANHTSHCIDYVTRCIHHDALLKCGGAGSEVPAGSTGGLATCGVRNVAIRGRGSPPGRATACRHVAHAGWADGCQSDFC